MAKKVEIKLTKEQQQYLVAGLLFGSLGVYCYWTYFWAPTAKKIEETAQRIEKTERDIGEARRQAARLPQLRKEIEDLEQQAEAAEKRLPRSKEVPGLIDTLSELAKQYGVTIVTFAPSGQANRQYFTELPYQLQVKGTYHSIAKFLTALALQERIFHTRNLILSPLRGGKSTETVAVTLQLVAFTYKG